MEQDIEDEILTKLHRDEKELKNEEKRVRIISIITSVLIIILFVGFSYLLFYKAKNIETTIVKVLPSSASATPTPTSTIAVHSSLEAVPTVTSSPKDIYINIGAGTNQSADWEDVPGALGTFDISQYSNIKEVHLETNVNVPSANGTISVRLFNKTDNYAVWNSERTVQAQAVGDLLISQNIIYDKGPKLYQVQIKTQLGVVANLIQSRLHVITGE